MKKQITFLFFTLITSVIIAQTATVNGTSYNTLAEAYTASAGGDIIVIDGIFDENLTSNKAVSLQGDDPATDGIVYTGTGRVLFYTNSVSGDFSISNLTISGGNVGGNGGGLFIDKSTSSQITLSNLIVENNSAGSNGGGISIVSANVNISNVISRNNSANNGGGIHMAVVNGAGSTSGANKIINMSNSLINNNTSTLAGGAFYAYAGGIALNKTLTINMENTTIALNSASASGGIGYAVGGQLADGSGLPSLNLNMTHVTCGRNTATGNAANYGLYFNRTHGSAANNLNFNAYNSIFVAAGTITARGINFAFAQSPNFINNVSSNLNNTGNIANNVNNITGLTAGQIGLPTALTDEGGFSNVLALTATGDAVDHCTSATGTTLPMLDQRGYTRDASADAGAFELGGTLPVPVGANCAVAIPVTPGVYNDAAITVGSGGASQGDAADALWYVYTAEGDGSININSCFSVPEGVDTRLFVYTDGCDTLTAVANDDDGCDAPTTFGSILTDIDVVGGQEYLIEWDDRWGADAFDWELTFTPAPGFSCATAVVVTPGVYNDVAIAVGSGGASQGDAADALWYSYTAEADGSININSCISDPAGIDTRLFVYTDGCDTLTAVANDDDGCDAPNGFGSIVTDVAVVGGQEYLIEWDDRWGADAFDWELTFTPAPVALPITFEDNQLPVFNDFNGSGTQVIANPDASGANDSATVAVNVVPANAGFAGVNFAVENLDITTLKGFTMTVWSQVPEMPVLLKLENATTGVNAERAATTTTTGAWETISFDFSEEGDLTFESVTLFMNFNVVDPTDQTYYWDNLVQVAVVEEGVNCAVAIPVTPGVYNDAAITVGSGGAAQDDAADALWYVYTAEGDGSININSCFSVPEGIDTRLFVYTDGCDTLTPVGNDDDGCDAPTTFGSILTDIDVVGGQDYLIEWDDRWGADAFDWELTFTPAPGFSCATAVVVTPGVYNDVAIVVGSAGASQGDAADALWYSYTPEADGSININSCFSVPEGIDTRLFVYTDGCDTLTPVANDDDGCDAPTTFGSVVTDVAVVGGQEYLIEWDDRWGADAFDWELTFTPAPAPVVELPITFEDGQLPIFNDFNGSATQVIANPDASGANDSATVAENVVPANAAFAGVNFAVENLDITTLKGFTMTVWSQVPDMPVLLKLENATTGVNAERAATTTTTGAWETISFDFSEEGDLTFESVTVFMNFNVVGDTDQTYYWDNLVQGEPLNVTQNDLVDIAMYPNPATSFVTLEASQEIATIQIMNLLGQTVSIIEVNNTSSTVNVSQLRTGVYIANVLFSNGSVQTMKFIKE